MFGVSAGRVALAGSMSEYIGSLLSLTPELRDVARQQVLTDRFLTPMLPALQALFEALRAEVDPGLRRAFPGAALKPYPIGRCEEITIAVRRRLADIDPAVLTGAAARGAAALRAFTDAGGAVRQVWGDLRGQYFQNALIVGALYLDVSNDTVVIDKPPVELRPFVGAGLSPIADYSHFARIAERYWSHRVLPNHLTPELAPYLPLIEIGPSGRLRLGPANGYMLGLTLSNGFATSEQALAAAPMPPRAFESFGRALRGGSVALAASADAGRAAALACCQAYRAAGRAECALSYNRAMAAGREVNRRLARLVAAPLTPAAMSPRAA